MKRSPTTVCHIPNRIRVKAAKCKSSHIDAPIREKPLRNVMSYPNRKMVSVDNTGLPTQITHYCSYQTTCSQVGMMASLPAQSCTVPTEQEAGSSSWPVLVFWKRQKSPHTGNLLARSQSRYLLSYATIHSSLDRSYYPSTISPGGNLL
jgi:hypothetical protein